MDIAFAASPAPTLGVEWEIALVDESTGDLASRADEVLGLVGDLVDSGVVHRELLRNTAELVTPICRSVPEAMAQLAGEIGRAHV